jgi:PAS domain S-box-containing protein
MAMNRNATAKFLEILLMTGQVEQIEHGMSKIFILSRRTGIPTMLDRSDDHILVLDKDMKIVQVNENYTRFSGLNLDALLGKRPDAAGLPVIGGPLITEKILQAHYGADIRTEVREVMHGTEFFFDVRMTPTVFNDGTRGITIIIGDITREKKKLASVADESRSLVEGVLSCIDDAVVLLDFRTSAIVFANPAALRMFGCPLREMTGAGSGFLPAIAGKIPGYPGRVQDAFRQQGYYETESQMKRYNSGEFPVNLHLRPICDSNGDVRNIVVVIRDLTGCKVTGQVIPQDTWAMQLRGSPRITSPESRWSGSVL